MEKMRQWVMLTAIGVLGVLAVGWFVVVSPQRSHAAALRTQAGTVQSHISTLQSQVAQLQAEKKALPAEQKLFNQIAVKIPDNPALPALIRQLSVAAESSGVDLVSLAPSAPTAVAAAAPVAPAAVPATGAVAHTAAVTAAPLSQIPLTIQVTGSYYNIESFFAAVEGLSRAMLVSGFTLAPASGASGSSSTAGAASTTTASGTPAAGQLAPGSLTGQVNAVVFMSQPAAVAPAPTTLQSSTAPSSQTTK